MNSHKQTATTKKLIMKQLIFLFALGISLFSCTSTGNNKEAVGLAIANKYMEAVETNNVAVMDSLLADNYMATALL
jgi:hypothetical protein